MLPPASSVAGSAVRILEVRVDAASANRDAVGLSGSHRGECGLDRGAFRFEPGLAALDDVADALVPHALPAAAVYLGPVLHQEPGSPCPQYAAFRGARLPELRCRNKC